MTETEKEARQALLEVRQFLVTEYTNTLGHSIAQKQLDRVDLAIAALHTQPASAVVQPEPPHGWVLIPNEPATPTPDYEDCARQATEATGLPTQYSSAWLSIFIREINRWCQHAAATQPSVEVEPTAQPTKLHPAVKPDTLVNGGALQMALMALRRSGKNEIADELYATATQPDYGVKTGWPPGLLQDDDKGLSKWLSKTPNAKQDARDAVISAGGSQ